MKGDAMKKVNDSVAVGKGKPGKDFPLWLHPSGRWCKKVRQKVHYFGKADDPQGALNEWLRVKDSLIAGRARPIKTDVLTIGVLCNHFLTAKKRLLDTQELTPRSFANYKASTDRLVAAFGSGRLVSDLTAADFDKLRVALAAGRGPVSLRGDVLNIRMAFKYGYDNGLIQNPMQYGQAFKIPAKAVLRRARQANGKRMFDAAELRTIIDAAEQPMKALILLGINCAFGATDISSLPVTAVDLAAGWIDFPRPKTSVERRIPLWPETVAALREVLATRKEPKSAEDAGLVFLTRCRVRWVRSTPIDLKTGEGGHVRDAVACEMTKLLTKLDIKRERVGFYALRHTFETIAGETRDQIAVNAVMGHADQTMAAAYREHISDERLHTVVNHVRSWLFQPNASRGRN
jgi:integrase